MTHLNYWSDTAELREPVETTLSELGYDNGYVGIIKKIFRISQTPVSRKSPYQYLFQDDFCHQPALKGSTYLAYTHTGQEVYPFGQSCLRKLNRVSEGKGALFGSTASNCASTFKVIDLYRRRQQESKQIIVTCDTGFTSILKDIPGSTVTGDARSAVSLDVTSGNYQFVDYQSQVYPAHFGGAWEEPDSHSVYEKTYKDRIVALIESALAAINPNPEARIAVVPHNVNVYTWNAIEKKLGNPQLTFFTGGVSDHGHCYGSDAFINLKLLEQLTVSGDADVAHAPDFFLCVTAGVGGFFSSVTLKRNEADKESFHD
ncbi:hypothetical protein GCE9029_02260 [Grimontia celer]|uniref:Beta-ketoacyl-[acyl-carrier-protein] synthase III C-terminal domain-containing protein n=1 Tax=Grimontia celer TaxID=1796497 RepID=A0A128F3A7_9GAMM|nr:hypothetical protein [Grimontia celer]CZF80894.1 hypothetical protein GCE9029_02260 [Grimontia celer]